MLFYKHSGSFSEVEYLGFNGRVNRKKSRFSYVLREDIVCTKVEAECPRHQRKRFLCPFWGWLHPMTRDDIYPGEGEVMHRIFILFVYECSFHGHVIHIIPSTKQK